MTLAERETGKKRADCCIAWTGSLLLVITLCDKDGWGGEKGRKGGGGYTHDFGRFKEGRKG